MAQCKTIIEYAGQKTTLLTWTSAMAAWSFSLPAGDSCPMILADKPEHICSGCYAMLNFYNMPNVSKSQHIRFAWTKDLLKTNPDEFVRIMTDSIRDHVKNGYFRFHDAGDLYSLEYTEAVRYICQNLPDISFWIPTRSYRAPSSKWQIALRQLAQLPNVSLRPSALSWNDIPPRMIGYAGGTTGITEDQIDVGRTESVCPKSRNGNDCKSNNCRKCWNKEGEVAYIAHGILGRHEPFQITNNIIKKRQDRAQTFTKLTSSIIIKGNNNVSNNIG